ncbi:MAG: hypothetical protein IPN46_06730 [Saprospiraceae bacterium]|nr:hypothetical protein [Saprospiraceae bacterium]
MKNDGKNEYAMAVIANGSVYGYDFAVVAPEGTSRCWIFDILLVKKTHIFKYFLFWCLDVK